MKTLKAVFFVLSAAFLTTSLFVFWIYTELNEPSAHDKSSQYVEIPKGAGTDKILDILVSEGILRSRYPVLIYLKLWGIEGKLKAGEYQFASPITPLQVISELEKGQEKIIKLTIPEGWTRFDIAKRLAEKLPTEPPMNEKQILELMNDVSLIKDFDPLAQNLEGYMYPDTYILPAGAKPSDAIKRMVEQFRRVWRPEWTEKARQMGFEPRQIVIIASLIETETKIESEKPLVASVIYNRLRRNIPLGIDQTVVYIAKMENRWDGTIHLSDIEVNSPYNTRKFVGLPPGPIASPSKSSIEAALNPAQTDYLYYVLDAERRDGSHKFHASSQGFEQDKRLYQQWLEEQRKQLRKENE
ncbi:MAG: endolytic transglycosylase MltG [Pyrinomonadaceae bacterium]|nr:endolytic transglycosylase MltG [Pyrinomonadaceae bacterium]MCX7640715.1 endolytic transglycosylase MltG [Pyrinomonadaceae bacterium]MDW8305317.1 endolytic transglycosylase MltG [Acidobacteriota bacterium]